MSLALLPVPLWGTLSSCFSRFCHLSGITGLQGDFPSLTEKNWAVRLFKSTLDYCDTVLAGNPDNSLKMLQFVQNTAGTVKRDHTSLHWLPAQLKIHFRIYLMTNKALNVPAPSHLKKTHWSISTDYDASLSVCWFHHGSQNHPFIH